MLQGVQWSSVELSGEFRIVVVLFPLRVRKSPALAGLFDVLEERVYSQSSPKAPRKTSMSEVVVWPSPVRSAKQLDRQPKSPRRMRASDTVTVPSPSKSGGQSLVPSANSANKPAPPRHQKAPPKRGFFVPGAGGEYTHNEA